MRYVSPNQRLIGPEAAFEERTGPVAQVWDRVRESMGGGRFWTAAIVLLLTITVARSTSTVHWVDGIDVITVISLLGAFMMGALALSPVRDVVALVIGLLLSPIVAFAGAWPQIHARHPDDIAGLPMIGTWWLSMVITARLYR